MSTDPTAKRCWMPMADSPSDTAALVARCGLPIWHAGRCEPLPVPGATVNPDLKAARAREQPTERLDITGRDPAALTPIEILAFAYPDVHALRQQLQRVQRELEEEESAHESMRRTTVKHAAAIRRVRERCADGAELDNSRGWVVKAAEILAALDEPDRPEPA